MTTRAFYQARADECAREAAGSSLANVRDRLLRSQAAWQTLADRLQHTETLRAGREGVAAEAVAELAMPMQV